MITKQYVARQLLAYMSHQISLADLVTWAENSIMDGGFEPSSEVEIRQVLGILGVANVSDFGLLWEDCEQLMLLLGYKMKVEAALVA